jgi:hypothetical protein
VRFQPLTKVVGESDSKNDGSLLRKGTNSLSLVNQLTDIWRGHSVLTTDKMMDTHTVSL